MSTNTARSASATDTVSMLQINNDRKEMFINPNGGAKGFYICDESLQEKLTKLIDYNQTKYIDVDGHYYERVIGWHVSKIIRQSNKQIIAATPTGTDCDFTYTISENTYTNHLQLSLDANSNITGAFENIVKYGDDKAVLTIPDPQNSGSNLYCILEKYTFSNTKNLVFDEDLDGWEGGSGNSTLGTLINPVQMPFYMKKNDQMYKIDIYDDGDGIGLDFNRALVSRDTPRDTTTQSTSKVFESPFYIKKGNVMYSLDVYDNDVDGIGLNIQKVNA